MIEKSIQTRQVIPIWSIIYDDDPGKVYTFSNWSKVMAAVDGSIKWYLIGDKRNSNIIIRHINSLVDLKTSKLFIIKIENLNIRIHRWELDYSSGLLKTILRCIEFVPAELQSEINQLFVDSSDYCI